MTKAKKSTGKKKKMAVKKESLRKQGQLSDQDADQAAGGMGIISDLCCSVLSRITVTK